MKKQMTKLSVLSVVVFVLSAVLFVAPAAQAIPIKAFPVDSSPYGRSYGEWAEAWQQWAIGIPASSHPLFDTGPADTGQSGPVFFLGGKFCAIYATNCGTNNVTRTITIPAGKAILVPVMNAEFSTVETGSGDSNSDKAVKDINGLRKLAAEWTDADKKLALDVDGFKFTNLASFRVQSPAFQFYLPADDIFTAIGEGTFTPGYYFPGVDDGYYVMLQPLPVGKHTIHLHGENGTWVLDVTYHVTVQK
jgi:hypothetical protein